jgi:hypothetical protein
MNADLGRTHIRLSSFFVDTTLALARSPHQHARLTLSEEHADGTVSSDNWSGYAVTAARDWSTQAAGSWIVPAVTCTSGSQYAAFGWGSTGTNRKQSSKPEPIRIVRVFPAAVVRNYKHASTTWYAVRPGQHDRAWHLRGDHRRLPARPMAGLYAGRARWPAPRSDSYMPVPLRATVCVAPTAVSVTVSVAARLPVAVGTNSTLT